MDDFAQRSKESGARKTQDKPQEHKRFRGRGIKRGAAHVFQVLGQLFSFVALALLAIAQMVNFENPFTKIWITCSGLVAAVIAFGFLWADIEARNRHEILPGSAPTPDTHGPPPKQFKVGVFLGTTLAYGSHFPLVVIRQNGEELMVLKEGKKGILFSAKFFNAAGKIMLEVVDNEPHVNSNTTFRVERPPHGLIVYDDEGRKAVDLAFLNPRYLKLMGSFYLRGGIPMRITDEFIETPGLTLRSKKLGFIGDGGAIFSF